MIGVAMFVPLVSSKKKILITSLGFQTTGRARRPYSGIIWMVVRLAMLIGTMQNLLVLMVKR